MPGDKGRRRYAPEAPCQPRQGAAHIAFSGQCSIAAAPLAAAACVSSVCRFVPPPVESRRRQHCRRWKRLCPFPRWRKTAPRCRALGFRPAAGGRKDEGIRHALPRETALPGRRRQRFWRTIGRYGQTRAARSYRREIAAEPYVRGDRVRAAGPAAVTPATGTSGICQPARAPASRFRVTPQPTASMTKRPPSGPAQLAAAHASTCHAPPLGHSPRPGRARGSSVAASGRAQRRRQRWSGPGWA